jgi:predicted lipase
VKKILFTGHSLGAALASINAIYTAMMSLNIPLEVYNFGSPRFANENLAQFVMQNVPNHYRMVHNRDIVPHLPPEVEYRHVAHEIFFSKDMINYKVCDDSGEDPTCSNQFFPNYNAADHSFYFYQI